jgi:phosphoribosylformimino-5-aminoimidazole carboxamide ribotide isomerase
VTAQQAIERWSEGRQGVKRFVYTNIDHDGMLDGIDGEDAAMAARAAGDGHVILSGGIGELEHLQAIAALRSEQQLEGLDGVIVGKALYERRFTVAEALTVLDG